MEGRGGSLTSLPSKTFLEPPLALTAVALLFELALLLLFGYIAFRKFSISKFDAFRDDCRRLFLNVRISPLFANTQCF
jgi:hypothetical protein